MSSRVAVLRGLREKSQTVAEENRPEPNRFITPDDSQKFNQTISLKKEVVCQIIIPSKEKTVYGTGLLIGGNLLMTNHHVIPDITTAHKSHVVFFQVYTQDKKTQYSEQLTVSFSLSEAQCIASSPAKTEKVGDHTVHLPADSDHLDFMILALPDIPFLVKIQSIVFDIFKNIPLKKESRVLVLQCPSSTKLDEGSLKKEFFAASSGLIQKINDCSLHYDSIATQGSSGGAVVDENGDLIALHHQEVGNKSSDPHYPYLYEGVLITQIIKHLNEKNKIAEIKGLFEKYQKEHPSLETKLTQALQAHYKTFTKISFLYNEDDGALLIQNYVPLILIDRTRKDKSPELSDKTIPANSHTDESQKPIDLKILFEDESFKDVKEKRVVIFGRAGFGKSTLCQHIAYQWAVGKLWPQFKAIFWVKLRYLTKEFIRKPTDRNYQAYDLLAGKDLKHEGCDLEDYSTLLNKQHFRKNTLVLLDGDDELSIEAEQGSLCVAFNELKSLFPYILITSRSQNVSFSVKNNKTLVETMGFDEKSIDKYITEFFADPQKKFAKTEENLRAYLKIPLVQSLVHMPLNLAILCKLFKERGNFEKQDFLTVTSLYEEITEWLCKRFFLRPGCTPSQVRSQDILDANTLDLEETKKLLSALKAIAWEAMKRGIQYLPKKEAMDYFKELILINQNRNLGIFKIDQDSGSFIHKTFQEYFAALYLADLYLTRKNEASDFTRQFKLDPRYVSIFWMAAGYLSTKDNIALQALFDDLFSEPYDLAEVYELRLLARCFEECKDAGVILQYSKFIEQCIIFLKKTPFIKLKLNLFLDNPKLFSHKKLIEHLRNSLLEKNKDTQILLEKLADKGLAFSSEMIAVIYQILANAESDDTSIFFFITLLEKLVKNGQPLPGILKVLIRRLKNPKVRYFTWGWHLLENATKDLRSITSEDFDIFVSFLLDDTNHSDIKFYAFNVLRELARNRQVFSDEALEFLIADLKASIPNLNSSDKAVEELMSIFEELKKEILVYLIASLKNPQANSVINRDEVLEMYRKKCCEKYLPFLISKLKDPRVEFVVKNFAAKELKAYAENFESVPEGATDALLTLLNDQKFNSDFRCAAALALATFAEKGHLSPDQTIEALAAILNDMAANYSTKNDVVIALEQLAKNNHQAKVIGLFLKFLERTDSDNSSISYVSTALGKLIINKEISIDISVADLLDNPNIKVEVKKCIIEMLKNIAENNQFVSKYLLNTIIKLLKLSKNDSYVYPVIGLLEKLLKNQQEEAFEFLIELLRLQLSCTHFIQFLKAQAEKGQLLPKESISFLTTLLNDPNVDMNVKILISDALVKLAKNGQISPEVVLKLLISLLKEALTLLSKQNNSDISWRVASSFIKLAIRSNEEIGQERFILCLNLKNDSNTKKNEQDSFNNLVEIREILSQKTIDILRELIEDSECDNTIKKVVIINVFDFLMTHPSVFFYKKSLKTILSPKILAIFVDILKTPDCDFEMKAVAAKALKGLANKGQVLSQDAILALIHLLKDTSTEPCIKNSLHAIGEIANNLLTLPRDVVTSIFKLLQNLKLSKDVRRDAVDTLGDIVLNGQHVSEEAFEMLIELLKNSQEDSITESIASTLGKLAKKKHAKAIETANQLLKKVRSQIHENRSSAEIILRTVEDGFFVSDEVTESLNALLENSQVELNYKTRAVFTFEKQVKNGNKLSESTINNLTNLLNDAQNKLDDKINIVRFFELLVKNSHSLSEEVIKALVELLNAEDNSNRKIYIVETLGEIIRSRINFSVKNLQFLTEVLTNSKDPFFSDKYAADVLIIYVKSKQFFPEYLLGYLIKNYIDLKDSDYIYDVLDHITRESCHFFNQYNYELLKSLFFCVGLPFYYPNERFNVFDGKKIISLEKSANDARFYQKHSQDSWLNPINRMQFSNYTPLLKDFSSELVDTPATNSTSQPKALDSRPIDPPTIKKPNSPYQPAKWNEFNIASLLWLNPKTRISEEMIFKINFVHAYLHPRGFELSGVEADGNCFCTAFLKSYRTLSRKIPLIDNSHNKTSFLRETIAAQYQRSPQGSKNGKRVEQIKQDKEWLAAFDEGDLLAVALSMPIRLITVIIDGTQCGVIDMLTFTDGRKPRQEWDTIPKNEIPSECIIIVDVGGHFLYAKNIK